MAGILEGIRVLDFGRYIAGPFCCGLLADLGAEVIRIERPGGAEDRFIMPVTDSGEGSLYFHSNRGKKSLTLENTTPEGREVVRRLIAGSDVVVANLSPGGLKYFGLDYEGVRAIREDIILTTVNAFGPSGPLADAVGFDGVGQAVSGAVYLTGEPGHPHRSATAYVDFSTALSCAYGTLAAIVQRMRTGRGMHVRASLVGTALNVMAPILMEHAGGRNPRVPTGNRAQIAGPSDIFRAADGWFIMQVQGPKMYRRWCELVGRPELFDDPRYADDALRGRNGAALSAVMQAWAQTRTRDECLAALEAASLAASPVLSPDEVLSGTLSLTDTFTRSAPYPGTEGIMQFAPPVSFSDEAAQRMGPPPALGEHSREVLTSYGFSEAEIADLSARGII
ncbi:MAG: CoA transferase [Sphingomonas bacterium]